jgi:hypothetical protein
MTSRGTGRTLAAATLVGGLAAGLLAGCSVSGHGASASCSASQCTVTLDRSAAGSGISILGVRVDLVSVTGNAVTLQVADQTVTIPGSQSVQAGNLTIKIQSVSGSQIVLVVSAGP